MRFNYASTDSITVQKEWVCAGDADEAACMTEWATIVPLALPYFFNPWVLCQMLYLPTDCLPMEARWGKFRNYQSNIYVLVLCELWSSFYSRIVCSSRHTGALSLRNNLRVMWVDIQWYEWRCSTWLADSRERNYQLSISFGWRIFPTPSIRQYQH